MKDFDQAAATIRHELTTAVEAARADLDLSEIGRQRKLAAAWLEADRKMRLLREERDNVLNAEQARLTREAFGAPQGVDVTELREAIGFVDQHADNPGRAELLLERAARTGDALLARAVATVATERGWNGIVEAYRRDHDHDGQLAALQAHLNRHRSRTSRLAAGIHLTISRPTEIAHLGLNHLENLAAGGTKYDAAPA